MKKLFGCVCVCRVFLPVLLVLCTIAGVNANNIRVEGKTRVVSVAGDTAILEVNLRWDNSWRDDFNWDAAWVFFKFKKRGLENPWQHAYLSSSGHLLTPQAGNEGGGYAYMVGANGGKVNGLYVMRDGISEGNVSVRLRAKWPLTGSGLTSADFGEALNQIYVAVHAIEMVYILYGAYYLGDNYSNNCLTSNQELVNQGSYSASSIYSGYPAQNALPGYSGYWCSAGQGSEERWQIKFSRPYTITSFALGVYAQVQYGYLEGSHTGLNGDWVTLWSGGNNCFPVTSSYPFSNYLTVSSPGAYTYYRIRMKSGSYSGIYNISLKSQESPVVIDSEVAFALGIKGYNNSISLSASYPKGYAGFYVMKYETSQEQYVEFLNSLTLEQQKARVANNNFSVMKKGDYVFGDLKNPNCRNGIVFVEQRKPNTPVVFGNNLNPNNDLFSTDDGQTLACNYMSVEDMIAYCSWSGLRPMSELEYEKACRRFYPQVPDKGEYAWNTNNGINRLNGLSDLNYRGDEREQALSYLKNVNSGTTNSINGPVRCGLFATSATNQTQAGATYWGVMEMSGNLKELCMSVGNPGFDGHIGTGVYDAACWSTAVGSYSVRGGGFSSPDSLLRTSDRTEAMNYFASITQRDSTVGFRGVYSLSGIKIDGGEIKMSQDTACWGETDVLNVVAASCPDFPDVRFQYNWYVKKPGEAKFDIVDNASGESLKYEHFENKTAAPVVYTFRRTGICAMGVAESNEVTVKVLPEPFVASSYAFNPCPVAIPHRWEGMTNSWRIQENPDALIVEDGSNLLVNNLTSNGVYTLEARTARCSDLFTTQINVVNMVILTAATTYGYTGQAQCVVLPAGKYQIECWGARGGYSRVNGSLNQVAGLGGYTKGDIRLANPQLFFVYVGGRGADAVVKRNSAGGYNGGGSGTWDNSDDESSGGGGGASDVRLRGGTWNDFESLKSRIMVAGGGGGRSWTCAVGSAGGLTGVGGNGVVYAGTQTGGHAFGIGQNASGIAGSDGVGGGGGGYYGGKMRNVSNASSGCGGSSFISGHDGCNAINSSGSHTGQSIHYSGLYFTNTVMIDGAGYQWTTARGGYTGMPNLAGTGTMTGNTGHGQVKITPVN